MSGTTDNRCENCRFWRHRTTVFVRDTDEVEATYGCCKRHAPVGRSLTDNENPRARKLISWLWPVTEGSEWCGEHEALGAGEAA